MTTRMQKLIVYAALEGKLNEFVSKKLQKEPKKSGSLSPQEFKKEYEKADAAKKQKLIFEYAPEPTSKDLTSITMPLGKSKLIVQVLKKPVVINGGTPYSILPNPAPATLQALANKWFASKGGMVLPTNKMIKVLEQDPSIKNIYIDPLSSGYSKDGKQFSGQEVANDVGRTEHGLAFADRVQEKAKGVQSDSYRVSSKSIIQPWDSGDDRITFAGPYQKSVSRSGANMAHQGAVKAHHTEYEILIQDLAVNQATLIKPDGSKTTVYLKELFKSPTLYSYISDKPGYTEYDTTPVIG